MAEKLIKELVKAVKVSEPSTNKTHSAVVTRIDGEGVAWVSVAGADKEVPIESTSAEVRQGDSVNVEWRNNKLYIVGNYSDPSAGQARVAAAEDSAARAATAANRALTAATAAEASAETAATAAAQAVTDAAAASTAAAAASTAAATADAKATAAGTAASNAQTSADNAASAATAAQNSLKAVVQGATTVEKAVSVMQTALEAVVDYDPQNDTVQEYFWHDANGAHVLGDTSGYRNDIDSSGMRIVDVNTEAVLASFGTETIIKTTDGTELVHFGYDIGQAQSGTAIAPYYTLGRRRPVATIGNYSVAEGYSTAAMGAHSHAEGSGTTASGRESHAEGSSCRATTDATHAEGSNTEASGTCSHSEGFRTTASGHNSHAEGYGTTASGRGSHAEGNETTASGLSSHAQNDNTIAVATAQTAIGRLNVGLSWTIFEIGNGYFDYVDDEVVPVRSNALTVDWSGNVETAGDVTDGSGNVLSDKADSADVYTQTQTDALLDEKVDMTDALLNLDTSAATGTVDGDLYAAIVALGWQSEVID